MAKAAAVGPARDAGYWRDLLDDMHEKRAKAAARSDALISKHGTVALEAHGGDAAAAKRLERLTEDMVAALRVQSELDAALTGAGERLAEAEASEAAAARATRRARRDAVLVARSENARRAEGLIEALGETLAEMRAQAEEIMGLTAGRDWAETLKPIKTDQRLHLAMARAGFTWRDRQGAAHPLFPDAAEFAEAEIAAQAAYAGKDVR